jgi:hypothetical protein
VDVYRVVGTGGAEIRAPATGWPQAIQVRLHGFRPLASLQARAVTASATRDRQMSCEPARALLREPGYRCALEGQPAGETSAADDYVQVTIPPALLVPDTARVEVRWSEASAVAAR